MEVREKVERELSAVATLKVDEISEWRIERLHDARFFQRDSQFVALVRDFLANPTDPSSQAALRTRLAPLQESHGYGMFLFDAGGHLALTAPETQAPPAAVVRAGVATALKSSAVTVVDIYRNENSQEIMLSVAVS